MCVRAHTRSRPRASEPWFSRSLGTLAPDRLSPRDGASLASLQPGFTFARRPFGLEVRLMTGRLQRFGVTLALLVLAAMPPATAGAQPPAYITQWGSLGSGNGQFYYPVSVAVD